MTTISKNWLLQGVVADDPLLNRLGWKWIAKLKAYGSFWPTPNSDYAWAYRERTAIGFLAAAAWAIDGGVALEEYGAEKAHSKRGRIDLYTGFKEHGTPERSHLLWEAKHDFLELDSSLPPDGQVPTVIRRALRAAHGSATKLKPKENEIGMAVAFLTLKATGLNQSAARQRARALTRRLRERRPDSWEVFSYLATMTPKKDFDEHRQIGLLMIAERMNARRARIPK